MQLENLEKAVILNTEGKWKVFMKALDELVIEVMPILFPDGATYKKPSRFDIFKWVRLGKALLNFLNKIT